MIEVSGQKWFTLTEIATMFVKTPQTISNWRRSGKLKCKKISERKYLFSEDDIKQFIEG